MIVCMTRLFVFRPTIGFGDDIFGNDIDVHRMKFPTVVIERRSGGGQISVGPKTFKKRRQGSRCRSMKFFQDVFPVLDIAMHVPDICFIAEHAGSPKINVFL